MARSRTVTRRTPQRRKLVWARQSNINAAIPVGADQHFNANILSPFRTQVGATLPGLTVVRVRLSWTIQNPGAAQSRIVIAGIRKFTDSPDAAGDELLEVDGPASDPHADWMMFSTRLRTTDADTGGEQTDVDVKSMRKLDEVSDSLVLSFEAVDELAASIKYVCSVLVALP